MAARGDSRPRGCERILVFLVGGLQPTSRPVLPGPRAASPKGAYGWEAFPNHFYSPLSLLCSSVVRFNKAEAMCLGPGAPAGKKPCPESAAPRPPRRTHRLAQGSVDFRLHLPDVVAVCKKGREKSVTLS